MRIIKLLYLKYSLSFSICLFSSLIIFFIFSLLGNLNEDYLFNTIINLSLLNSIQILTYVPAFIFLISVVLFTIFLRSKNEMIIIKSYVNFKKLMLFFLPIVLIFTFFEINKKKFSIFIENSKSNLVEQNNKYSQKILINNENNSKTFIVLKNISNNNFDNAEYRSYKIVNKKISLAEFSDNLLISNNTLIAKNYTQYKENLIEDHDVYMNIDVDIPNLNRHNSIVKNISEGANFVINIKLINLLIFFILFFNYIFLIFSGKKYINNKESLTHPIIICLIFLIYSFFIFNNSLSIYKQEFEILASVIISMFVLKESLNE